MNAVLVWIKANVFIVVFAVVMVAAAIALPVFSSRMNAQVREEVGKRAANLSTLGQLERGEVLPGVTGIPNEATLRRYEQVAMVAAEDAEKVKSVAIDHNRKGRTVLMSDVLPAMPAHLEEILPKRFHERLVAAYEALLFDVNAGIPPDLRSLQRELEQVRTLFITQDLRKSPEEKLTAEEEKQLSDKLSNARLSMYVEAAKQIGIYFGTWELNIPEWNQARQPSVGELYLWQWRYWIVEDVFRAIHLANVEDGDVTRSPVKRIERLAIRGLPAAAPVGGGTSSGAGTGFGSARSGQGQSAPASIGTPINPKAPVQKDYRVSLTGRTTNPLYDVVYVELDVIVESARIPVVLDALAKYNFFTVTDLRLSAIDPFAELANGYFYGAEPVARASMTIETIWLREWTSQFMPQPIREVLGVADPTAVVTSHDEF